MKARYILLCFLGGSLFTSCKKFLDEKPLKEQKVPSKIQDLQTLLDNHEVMNEKSTSLGELLSDNFIFTLSGSLWDIGEADYFKRDQ